jgi:hypothetical protein
MLIMADKKNTVTTKDLENAETEVVPAAPAKKAAPKKAAPKKAAPSGDVMLFLRHGYGYSVGEVYFTRDHPYQLVDANTAKRLLATTQFEKATPKQVKEHYGE